MTRQNTAVGEITYNHMELFSENLFKKNLYFKWVDYKDDMKLGWRKGREQ